jgi:hypothetical protein
MKNLQAFLCVLICFSFSSFAQNQKAILTIEQIPGYLYPKTINPTIQTSPAAQSLGTLTPDATDIHIFPSPNP